MASLLEKIKENAKKRLTLPAGTDPISELARFKNFLKVETHRLKIQHRAGGGGLEICKARSFMMDEVLKYLILAVCQTKKPDATELDIPFALVALGGYGRGELNPHSDIDIMFLHSFETPKHNELAPYLRLLSHGFLYDLNIKVGHSVRNIDDCVEIAEKDIRSKTAFLEARLIIGQEELFEKFQKVLWNKCIKGREDEYIQARLLDQAARRELFGNSATMQEPNIKNGCGGLRDYQNLHWMIYVKYNARDPGELIQRELISESEKKQLDKAYDFLLRVRTELHYQANRAVDVLSKRYQPSIALRLGYKDSSPSRRIEEFMSDFYGHTRNIYLITKTLEQRLAFLPQKSIAGTIKNFLSGTKQQILDGFKIENNIITHATTRVFDDNPRRLLRVFLYTQKRQLTLHPELIQLIRRKIHLVQRDLQTDRNAGETFIEILRQRGNVAHILRQMHEVGFLGKYIPEFGKLTNLVQHEFFHQYTLDEHTLVCIEKLDNIWAGNENIDKFYNELIRGIERPHLLYLAMLLHDVGKGLGAPRGKHSEKGANVAYKVALRLGLDISEAEILKLLVQHHLLLAEVSQRRNIDDPSEILSCAKLIKNEENLAILTVLTVADTLGTAESLWNGFKDQLLQTLYRRIYEAFRKKLDLHGIEIIERDRIIKTILPKLRPVLDEEAVHIHLNNLPQRYLYAQTPQQIITDLNLIYKFLYNQIEATDKALDPVIHWHNEPNRGYAETKICTWDRAGLFSKITGSFSAAGLNILTAQIFTRADGIALDTFYVSDSTGSIPKREDREQFEIIINKVLHGVPVDLDALIARHKNNYPLHQFVEVEKIQTKISFLNDISDTLTVIEIEAEDQIGLLYTISKVFYELNLDISLAKICTEKGAAIDAFYVSCPNCGKITNSEHQKFIADKLKYAIAKLQATPAKT